MLFKILLFVLLLNFNYVSGQDIVIKHCRKSKDVFLKKNKNIIDKIYLDEDEVTYSFKDKLYLISSYPYTRFSRYTLFSIEEVIESDNKFKFNATWFMKIFIGNKNYIDIIQKDTINKEEMVSLFVNYKISKDGFLIIEYSEGKYFKVDLKNRNIQDIGNEIENFYRSFKYAELYRKFEFFYTEEIPIWWERRYEKIR